MSVARYENVMAAVTAQNVIIVDSVVTVESTIIGAYVRYQCC